MPEKGENQDCECRLCGERKRRLLFTRDGWDIIRCGGCGLAQLARSPSDEELEQVYREDYFKRGKYEVEGGGMDRAAAMEQQRRLDWLVQLGLAAGSRVLDVGCATGDFLIKARDHFEMWGMDVSEFAVQEARQRTGLPESRLRSGSLYSQPFEGQTFDAIVMWDVIEHVNDPHAAMQQMCAMLRAGGVFVCSTPNFGAPIARAMKSRWAFMTPPEHICFYDRGTLARLLQDHGLTVEGWVTKGKHANVGFLAHKARQMFPKLINQRLVELTRRGMVGNTTLYIPTGDIQYMAAKKRLGAA